MQRNLPPHLQKYAGAYMQQAVFDPSANRGVARPMQNGAPPPTYSPVTHLPRESHYVQYKGDPAHSEKLQSSPTEQQPAEFSPEQAYDFIDEPIQKQSRGSLIPANSSLPMRIAIFGGGLVVLLILFMVIKGFLGGGSSLTSFVTIAQDQQAIIYLADNAQKQPDLSESNKNFTATTRLSLASSQSDLINYMANNGKKVNVKDLSLTISKTTDEQLAAAASAATYNETYRDIMQKKLNSYMSKLKQAYAETSGPNGQALLSDQFEQAELLLIQLEETKS